MKILALVLLAISLSLIGCGKKSDSGNQPTNAPATSGNPLNAPGEYLGAMGKAQQSAIKTVDMAAINQAIQLFEVDKGRKPKDLNELVEEGLLPRIPDAPVGHKIVYDAASGMVKVVKQP